MSTDSGYSTNSSSPELDLPSSSYDGSHLNWKTFRQQVLGPHRIRIVENAPKERLPEALLEMIEVGNKDMSRFDLQKESFREQLTSGRAFGPSPLFPPNLLPSIDDEPSLSRCMVPSFSREALPERALNQMGPFYELSVPRSGLGCGFSASALTKEEISVIPSHLITTGTVVHYNTGYISPGASLYCPFLTFERALGTKEHRLEAASNQCAIAGAWCLRAYQLLYNKAWKGQLMPDLPVAFSCSIDNTFAVINLHWIDHGQAYCMAPLCKFDLSNDDHFKKFQVWMEAIGKWAMHHLLPLIKRGLNLMCTREITPPATPLNRKPNLLTNFGPDERLISSLKTTFGNIPWRFDDDEFTPVSSSTASWGSPMVADIAFNYPLPPRTQKTFQPAKLAIPRFSSPLATHEKSPPPAYAQNTELVWQKRFNHAMDEINDLQRQLQDLRREVNGSNISIKNDILGMRSTITSVLRKETLTVRNRSLSTGMQDTWQFQNTSRHVNGGGDNRPSPLTFDQHMTTSVTIQATDCSTNKDFMEKQQASTPPSPGLVSPGLISPGLPSPTFSVRSEQNIIMVPTPPPAGSSLWKWAAIMLSGHFVGTFIPMTALRIIVLGCVTDICMLAFASPHYPSTAAYLSSWLRPR